MKNAGRIRPYGLGLLWLLLPVLSLRAQYIVNECEWNNELTVIGESLLLVNPGGVFINRGTVDYRGVTSLVNEGGFSGEGVLCAALYPGPCDPATASGGLNVFDGSQSLTTISGSSPLSMHAVQLSRDIVLANEWQVVHSFQWLAGVVTTDRSEPAHRLHWIGGSSSGAAADRQPEGGGDRT